MASQAELKNRPGYSNGEFVVVRRSDGTGKHTYWEVECETCHAMRVLPWNKIKNNIAHCLNCNTRRKSKLHTGRIDAAAKARFALTELESAIDAVDMARIICAIDTLRAIVRPYRRSNAQAAYIERMQTKETEG